MGSDCVRVLATWVVLVSVIAWVEGSEMAEHMMEHGGYDRRYIVYKPDRPVESERLPLVLVFHGGGGNARQILRFSGLNELAEQHRFYVVYPQAVDGHWNDGRRSEKFREHEAKVDDVGWIAELLRVLERALNVDKQAVYAAGISNGGMFVQRLAVELSDRFVAVASITASLPEPLVAKKPRAKLAVLIMNGTEDPLVPYEGGEVSIRSLLPPRLRHLRLPSRGRVLSTERTIQYWLEHNQLPRRGSWAMLPDRDPGDGCRVERGQWGNGGGVSVVLYKVIGGGHTWPGRRQYLPVERIGRVCRDFDGSEAIWRFFSKHRRRADGKGRFEVER